MKNLTSVLLWLSVSFPVLAQDKLDVDGAINLRGTIKLNNDAGDSGQILTSQGDAADPVWANSAFSGGGRFWATITNSVRTGVQTPTGRGGNWILNNSNETTQEDTFDFAATFVQGTDITVSNGANNLKNFITINRSGLYHLEGSLRVFVTGDVDGPTMSPRTTMKLRIFKTGLVNSDIVLEEILMPLSASPSTGFANEGFNHTIKFVIDINLESGTSIAFYGGFNQLRMSASIPLIAMGFLSGGYISGHFIAD